jgi:hypothetical protein
MRPNFERGRAGWAALGLAFCLLARRADAGPPPTKKANDESGCAARIDAFRKSYTGGAPGRTEVIADDDLKALFPKFCFGTLRYRTAKIKPPEPLAARNLIVVKPEGRAERVATTKELEQFFRSGVKGVRDEAKARATVRAWLRLVPEVAQPDDPIITFQLDRNSVKSSVEGGVLTASGKTTVARGGTGALEVRMSFGTDGQVTCIVPSGKVEPAGERPA